MSREFDFLDKVGQDGKTFAEFLDFCAKNGKPQPYNGEA
jgi:hypothetical protein